MPRLTDPHTYTHRPNLPPTNRFDFDDSCVLPLKDEAVVTTPAQGKDSAYLLMYRSVSLNAAAGSVGGARVLPPVPPELWQQAIKVCFVHTCLCVWSLAERVDRTPSLPYTQPRPQKSTGRERRARQAAEAARGGALQAGPPRALPHGDNALPALPDGARAGRDDGAGGDGGAGGLAHGAGRDEARGGGGARGCVLLCVGGEERTALILSIQPTFLF